METVAFVTLSPNQSEFKNFFRDLIAKYEETAGIKLVVFILFDYNY